MAAIAEIIDVTLRAAGIPIVGVSVGVTSDRATWTVQFDPSATTSQRTQAVGILAGLATDATALHTQDQTNVKTYVAAMELIDKAVNLTILDQVNVIRSKLPTPLGAITPAQWIAAVQAKVDTL